MAAGQRLRIGDYLEARETANPGRKTRRWLIFGTGSGGMLGTVKWYPAWRQYCFFTFAQTVLNPDCLQDIAGFVKGATKAEREAQAEDREEASSQ